MKNLTERTDIKAQGLKFPLSQFKKKAPNFMALLGIFLDELQLAETAITQGVTKRYIANAEGWSLEQWGDLVGMPRPLNGAAADSDSAYRVLILGQIAANMSYGTLPDLYAIMGALQLTQVKLFDVYPASITVNFLGNSIISDTTWVRDILERATHPVQFDITRHTETPLGLAGDLSGYGIGIGEIGEGA